MTLVAGPRRERPLGGRVARLGLAVAIAFGGWRSAPATGRFCAADLASDPSDAGVVAARLHVRGRILDRDGKVLAAPARRERPDLPRLRGRVSQSGWLRVAPVRHGGARGRLRAELLGRRGRPARVPSGSSGPEDRGDDLRTSLSLSLQQQAVRLLGATAARW